MAQSVQKASILFSQAILLWGHQKFDSSQLCPNLCSFPESPILSLYFPPALILSPTLCLWLLFLTMPSALRALLICLHTFATVLSPSANPPVSLMRDAACPSLLLPGHTQSALAKLWENPLLSMESELLNLSQTLQLLLLTCSLGFAGGTAKSLLLPK